MAQPTPEPAITRAPDAANGGICVASSALFNSTTAPVSHLLLNGLKMTICGVVHKGLLLWMLQRGMLSCQHCQQEQHQTWMRLYAHSTGYTWVFLLLGLPLCTAGAQNGSTLARWTGNAFQAINRVVVADRRQVHVSFVSDSDTDNMSVVMKYDTRAVSVEPPAACTPSSQSLTPRSTRWRWAAPV